MPDVTMLIELADFYDVDIRDIIDGERKSEIMDKDTKDTLLKVAEYANEEHRKSQAKVLTFALGICIGLILCTLLFIPRVGFLYGIIDETLCSNLLFVLYFLALMLVIFYLRVVPFREKPSYEPEKSVQATVFSKEIVSGTQRSGRSQMGYSFIVTFRTQDGQMLELYAYEEEFGGLKEGMEGMLTYQGRYFVNLQ